MKHANDNWVKASRQAAFAELAELDAQLAAVKPLVERRAVLLRILGDFDALDGAFGGHTPMHTATATPPTIRAADLKADAALAIWRRAERILSSAGHPLSVPDIARLMLDAGWKGGKNVRESVRSSLERRPDVFVKLGPGVIALKSWPAEKRSLGALRNGREGQMALA